MVQSPSICLKSSVKFPQSVMIWGAMSSACVGPLCFLETNVTAPVYQEIMEHLILHSADQLFKDADFNFQQDLAPAHTAKSTPKHPKSTKENEKQETKKCHTHLSSATN